MQELKAAFVSVKVESPIDMEHIKQALLGYNFGDRYVSWAKRNYGSYSVANFSIINLNYSWNNI